MNLEVGLLHNSVTLALARLLDRSAREGTARPSAALFALAWDVIEVLQQDDFRVQITHQLGKVHIKISREGRSGEATAPQMIDALARATQRALLVT